MNMLALPEPYGYPNGIGISITVTREEQGDIIAGLSLGFGCPAFVIPKVADCINASKRYDCRVTLRDTALLKICLEQIGAELRLTDELD